MIRDYGFLSTLRAAGAARFGKDGFVFLCSRLGGRCTQYPPTYSGPDNTTLFGDEIFVTEEAEGYFENQETGERWSVHANPGFPLALALDGGRMAALQRVEEDGTARYEDEPGLTFYAAHLLADGGIEVQCGPPRRRSRKAT